MSIRVECFCGREFKVRDELLGKKVKCPECGSPTRVGEQDEEPEQALVRPTKAGKTKKKSSKKKSGLSGIQWALIGGGAGVLLIMVLCGGAISWLKRMDREISERERVRIEELQAERRGRGEPVTADEFPVVSFDAAALAEFTQPISVGSRTMQIPADFKPAPQPPGIQLPAGVTLSTYERPDPGPAGKLVIVVISAPPKAGMDASRLSSEHQYSVSGYLYSGSLRSAEQRSTVYGKVGAFFFARTIVHSQAPNDLPMITQYLTILDETRMNTVSIMGFAADDTAGMTKMESLIGTLK